jgi:hypothetical protein
MATCPPSEVPPPEKSVKEVELLTVMVARQGRSVSCEWSLHPQMKKDLLPDELKEVTELMSQVASIVGARFSAILSAAEPDQPGTA